MTQQSGSVDFAFIYRADLHSLPPSALAYEDNLHTMFAKDKRDGYGHIYYALPNIGIVRIDPDMQHQSIIELPSHLKAINFHSCKIAIINNEPRLILTANDHETIIIISLDGTLDFSIQRPNFDVYQGVLETEITSCSSSITCKGCSKKQPVKYQPTDTTLIEDKLYIADGYAANYISVYDIKTRDWSFIFGGKTEQDNENGKFRTAHSITVTPDNKHLIITDRWNSRLQIHGFDGSYIKTHHLPHNAWLCSIDFINWNGRILGVIACLYDIDEDKKRPAPIYIVDGQTFEILATIRPKEDLGIEEAQRIHNAIWHQHDNRLFLICHSWNGGKYFVLEHLMKNNNT